MPGFFSSLSLHKSCAPCNGHREFLCATVLLCPENSHSPSLVLTVSLLLLPQRSLIQMSHLGLGTSIVSSYSLLLIGYVLLIAIYCKKKLLAGMRDATISEYINKSLGIILMGG